MAKLQILAGSTSKTIRVFIQDNSVTTGAGLTGLTYASGSLSAYYFREGAATSVAISLATATLGTWATGGFIVVDGTNMPGLYELGIPNLALASGAKSVAIYLFGATHMAPCLVEIELTATDNQNSNTFGLLALPAVAPAAAGGLVTCDSTNSVKIQTPLKKDQGFNLAFIMRDISGNATPGLIPTPGVVAQTVLNGGTFGICANAVSEIAYGWYYIVLTAADVNAQSVGLRFSSSGMQDTDIYLPMLP